MHITIINYQSPHKHRQYIAIVVQGNIPAKQQIQSTNPRSYTSERYLCCSDQTETRHDFTTIDSIYQDHIKMICRDIIDKQRFDTIKRHIDIGDIIVWLCCLIHCLFIHRTTMKCNFYQLRDWRVVYYSRQRAHRVRIICMCLNKRDTYLEIHHPAHYLCIELCFICLDIRINIFLETF